MSRKEVIIIESPTKVHSIEAFMPGAKVIATKGHFKDLPEDDIGVDLDTYRATFVLNSSNAKNMLQFLKSECKDAKVYIASDPDREGYAIAKMVYDEISPLNSNIYRAEFYEITKKGIDAGIGGAIEFKNTNLNAYDAFLGRRIGDRLIGYLMSGVANREIGEKGHSVGRVQSSALRLIVEREEDIIAFSKKPESERVYFKLALHLKLKSGEVIKALHLEEFLTEEEAVAAASSLSGIREAKLIDIKHEITKDKASPPLMTSDLISEGDLLFGYDGKKTMQIAQKLFEKGLITYMRTDSTHLSEDFLFALKDVLASSYPNLYQGNKHSNKVTQAGAHEAVRPSNEIMEALSASSNFLDFIKEVSVSNELSVEERKIFNFITARAFASQARAGLNNSYSYEFSADGQIFKFAHVTINENGWRILFKDILGATLNQKTELNLDEGDALDIDNLEIERKKRKAPSRFKEGELTKELEKRMIGRPSTYVSYLETLKARSYVSLDAKRKLIPSEKAFKLINYLRINHAWVVDYTFTAEMEEYLDQIVDGKKSYVDFCKLIHEKMGFTKPLPKKMPTENQLKFAETLALKLGKPIPSRATSSSFELSKWINSAKAAISKSNASRLNT